MAFVLRKAAEEVTERALVPYAKEKIVESGLSTIAKCYLFCILARQPRTKSDNKLHSYGINYILMV